MCRKKSSSRSEVRHEIPIAVENDLNEGGHPQLPTHRPTALGSIAFDVSEMRDTQVLPIEGQAHPRNVDATSSNVSSNPLAMQVVAVEKEANSFLEDELNANTRCMET